VPTIAAPHSTSINAITSTPDMRWVFSGGADGYIRRFNWVDTANGKLALTVAQRHPFVDSVTKAGVLLSYWENEDQPGTLIMRRFERTVWLTTSRPHG
jgi:transcriptional activator SPT8